MAALQDPEIQLAQKLASNEKPIRTKALKKLKKYINVRSQKATDGFTSEEMLKLWKGLFYCLWMQDKPVLQEELSNSVSALIHTFHDINGQLLYLESSLKTFKREWTGIDRLRMDKFYQLVRFMFKQTFEMLKRKHWDSRVVARFLELFATEFLNNGNDAPAGLQLHILDLYLTELAAVGSSELTADQNLKFIEPFCKTAAKTKDRTLFRAICNSIFSTIIDQAPYAIEDLMKELKATESSDSSQSSDGDEENLDKQRNGNESYLEQDNHQVQSGDSETDLPFDDADVAPVLQFDYAALAEKLFVMSSRCSTPSQNRQRLYKIIKVLQDLSEGLFPQDGYPEEVSTDEDDEMFGSRKRMRRGSSTKETAKNQKKKDKLKQDDDSGKDDVKAADLIVKDTTMPRVGKQKPRRDGSFSDDLNASMCPLSVPWNNYAAGDTVLKLEDLNCATALTECKTNKDKAAKVTIASQGTTNEKEYASNNQIGTPLKNKSKRRSAPVKEVSNMEKEPKLGDDASCSPDCKRKKNKPNKETIGNQSTVPSESECASDHQTGTPLKKKNKRRSAQVEEVSSIEKEPKMGHEACSSSEKPKKKGKIPVVFEFEADERESATPTSDIADRAPGVKKEILSTLKDQPKLGKRKTHKDKSCDLVAFRRNAKLPKPLFFRAKGSWKTPVFGNEMGQTPTPDSKKVTFHLKNNKITEFKKNDRSLLLSPEGSSKVPFDPKQKPKCGVLKSSPMPFFTKIKKTLKTSAKRVSSSPKSIPKRRPTASDFF
ncbi:ribosomal RNA processing protein 1 homolog B isoform X2 [Festucalex cinctus]